MRSITAAAWWSRRAHRTESREEPDAVAERAWRMARDRTVVAVDGSEVAVAADTICLHGDTPGAARLAVAVRARLLAEGVQLRALAGGRG